MCFVCVCVNVCARARRTLEELLQWNSFTRSHAIGFIAVHIRGMAGQLFSDFGTDFVARDLAGEVPKTRVIDNIDIDNETGKAFVRLVDEKGHLPFGENLYLPLLSCGGGEAVFVMSACSRVGKRQRRLDLLLWD